MTNLVSCDDFVAESLRNSGHQNYQRLLLFKYALLCESLLQSGIEAAASVDYLERNLNVLKKIKGNVFLESGTPFFWMNIARGRSAIRREKHNLLTYSRHIVMLAFDSFFDYLEDGTMFTLPAVGDSNVVLPSLKIIIPSRSEIVTLQRLNSENVEIRIGNVSCSINLKNVEPEYRIPYHKIPGHDSAVVLSAKDPALFETEYIDTISLLNVAAVSLSQKVGRAFEMIGEADPNLGSQIKTMIKWIFPIITKNPSSTHNSFTAKRLLGGIFLSGGYKFIPLLEAVVHEFHHSELYMLMATQEIISDSDHRLYYSPWREDARPLHGLFHAVHVFSQVEDFYSRTEGVKSFYDYNEFIRARRIQLCQQLRVGLAQLRQSELPVLGQEICSFISDLVDRHEDEMGVRNSSFSRDVLKHVEQWCIKYPELADDIILPTGRRLPN